MTTFHIRQPCHTDYDTLMEPTLESAVASYLCDQCCARPGDRPVPLEIRIAGKEDRFFVYDCSISVSAERTGASVAEDPDEE